VLPACSMPRRRRLVTRRKDSGHAIVEASLMVPWLFFLFFGTLDLGIYFYAAICTQNAARAAAVAAASFNSAPSAVTSCNIVLDEMRQLPNVRSISTCTGTLSPSQPVIVTTGLPNGPDGAPAVQVSVQYLSVAVIPIPGLISSRMSLTRTAIVRSYSGTP
jgi:Flp pilus assembly protein TadG